MGGATCWLNGWTKGFSHLSCLSQSFSPASQSAFVHAQAQYQALEEVADECKERYFDLLRDQVRAITPMDTL